jgi:hypothetical protein
MDGKSSTSWTLFSQLILQPHHPLNHDHGWHQTSIKKALKHGARGAICKKTSCNKRERGLKQPTRRVQKIKNTLVFNSKSVTRNTSPHNYNNFHQKKYKQTKKY